MNFLNKAGLFFILFLLLPISVFGQCVSVNKAFPSSGETLKYSAFFNWKAVWIRGGVATFEAKTVGIFYHFSVKARTLPKWRWLYDVNSSIEAYMNRHTMAPVSYASNTLEDKHWRKEKFSFYKNRRFRYSLWTDDNPQGSSVITNHPDCSADLLNEVYLARNVDFNDYPLNKDIYFNLLFTSKMTKLIGQVLGRESVKTKNGKIYNCLKCKSNSISGSIFDSSCPVYVWITDDDRHIPVYIQCKIKVGYLKVYLDDIN